MGNEYSTDTATKLTIAQKERMLHIVGNGVSNSDPRMRCDREDGPCGMCFKFDERIRRMMEELRQL